MRRGASAPITSTSTTNETKIHRGPPQAVVAGFVAAAAGVLTVSEGVLTVAAGVASAATGVLTVSAGVAAAAGVADSL